MQMQRTDVWAQGGNRMNWETEIDVRALSCVKQTASGEPAAQHGELRMVLCGHLGGWEGGPRGEGYRYGYS